MSLLRILLDSNPRFALHLPVHGRGEALPPRLKRLLRQQPGCWDLPELPEIGGPLDADGAIAESQAFFAARMGVDCCWFGVNGATGLLQAALLAMAAPGEAVLLPRNAHRSLIAACELGGLLPVFLPVPFDVERGHPGAMTADGLSRSLDALPDLGCRLAAAVLVHPTYHGYAAEIAPLVDLLHARGLPVLVDEAHGSHLAFATGMGLPPSALTTAADLVVHSLHKSAPGLAQTAVLWQRTTRISSASLRLSLQRLQSSSPSALLLASCEATLDWMLSNRWSKLLQQRLEQARRLHDRLDRHGVPRHPSDDPFRLILNTATVGVSGLQADTWFMSRGLIAELPEPLCLTLCLGFARHRGLSAKLRQLWPLFIKEQGGPSLGAVAAPPLDSVRVVELSPAAVSHRSSLELPLHQCADRIAAEMICPYPPGIPLLVPGERIDPPRVQWLQRQHARWPEQVPGKVKVLA
ncbi:MAG: aminotransferase class I/II-fold pyridoxal phosphate-dependent enzyme [Synechococcus sp. BS307-5m-G39]|nr:aminotransferase class I/II-fold pyridoxal phosphate-dependent enzyme [Synechococcus sp. BS307-5m-G39]